MRRCLPLLAVLLTAIPLVVEAHLCNDVFVQAKDNLAVKVDIRDGQLRVGKEASFRVYLLNTMDRVIANINLEVDSKEFDADVRPGQGWRSFPRLEACKKGGKKEYFDVSLKRKPGVPDGKYEIGLRLFNGKKKSMEFKTVTLDTAAATRAIKKKTVKVDGSAGSSEWKSAVLCTDFYQYEKKGKYFENKRCQDQARFHVTADDSNLYCYLAFQGGKNADEDKASVYVAPSTDAKPKVVHIDRVSGKVSGDGATGVVVKKASGGLECKIPWSSLGISGAKEFLLNFTRSVSEQGRQEISYWRGNKYSITDPVVYDKFVIAR